MDFKVFVEMPFAEFGPSELHEACAKKSLLTIANGFEDGSWREDLFHEFIWDHVTETALTARERLKLGDRHFTALSRAVKNLRLTSANNDISRGSEIAEIFLYGVMRRHYSALSVVPKIFHKQNVNDNAKGADGVHIVIDGDDFSLWFGEAKFYSSIEDARLKTIIDSVEQSLRSDKMRKENSIILNLKDLDVLEIDDGLRERIKDALSHSVSLDQLKPKLHVPILLIHECQITAKAGAWSDQYESDLRAYHIDRATSYFSRQLNELKDKVTKYADISFHLILFPVPNKAGLVDSFHVKADAIKGA